MRGVWWRVYSWLARDVPEGYLLHALTAFSVRSYRPSNVKVTRYTRYRSSDSGARVPGKRSKGKNRKMDKIVPGRKTVLENTPSRMANT